MNNLLKNKTILVTGCGKGIGFNFTTFALKQGAVVLGITRSKLDLKKFRSQSNLKVFIGDVNNTNQIKKVFDYAKKNKIKINCLVNNSGIRHRESFLKISEKNLRKTFENNFFSIFKISQLFLNNCFKKKMTNISVVNISSIVGKKGFSELTAYASSKSALYGLTKSLCAEYAHLNYRFNLIEPGFTKTSYYKKFKKRKKLYNWTISRIPSGRWGDPENISNLIGFLLSDNSSYINGEAIAVDGGWTNT
tara:strand:- start:78 stop:824 length:747 start_codon:yes stop_codon:yes gene_type:complete